jgi:hypothetical protein
MIDGLNSDEWKAWGSGDSPEAANAEAQANARSYFGEDNVPELLGEEMVGPSGLLEGEQVVANKTWTARLTYRVEPPT